MLKRFFKSNRIYEPLNYDLRKYFENNILFLKESFPSPSLDKRKVFILSENDFPIEWNNSKENAISIFKIVSENMQIDFDSIEIDFYTEGMTELNVGGSTILLENDEEHKFSAGLYFDKNEKEKYEISINEVYLNNPEVLIGTIAHELSHIKLLGEKEMEENDEYLTDLATVFFGFGVFGANSSFQFSQESDRWSYSSTGYLNYDEWAYCLALFAFLRYEENPYWSNYLNPTVKKEFQKCLKYMIDNEEQIFDFEEVK